MELTIFAKKGTTNDGRKFTRYLTKMVRKSTGEIISVSVKFREECGAPSHDDCPINIIVDKADANMDSREFINKSGDPQIGYTLWVSAWSLSPNVYEDHSLDDF